METVIIGVLICVIAYCAYALIDHGIRWVSGQRTASARLWADAMAFMIEKHANTKRKYTGEPYANHPVEVANIVAEHGGNLYVQIAALLHDLVEDEGVTIDQIAAMFGWRVAFIVDQLTKITTKEHGKRPYRSEIEAIRLESCHPDTAVIKAADMISNTRSIVDHDLEFAKIYVPEKRRVYEAIKSKLPEGLRERLLESLEDAEQAIADAVPAAPQLLPCPAAQ